ncbi:MAG TPA: CPBP family glutamic-type intramembrane protease, partial [Candidatus Omnitrophota bacterium]|nr:CPBP family glutamic-type intramembrane protease [Candidatus Omnitrophota bacterium]
MSTFYADVAYAQRPVITNVTTITDIFENNVTNPNSKKHFSANTFQLPEYLGEIKDLWSSKDRQAVSKDTATQTVASDEVTIIHIQDAHCNYDAQKKISEIIAYLNDVYGISSLNLEGGAGRYDFSVFNDAKRHGVVNDVADYFLKEGELNGAEYYGLTKGSENNLWGIENGDLYKKNLEVYQDLAKERDTIEKLIKNLSSILNSLKVRIFSKEMLDFDKAYIAFKNGNMDFKTYAAFLGEMSGKYGRDLEQYVNFGMLLATIEREKNIDFKEANKEREKIVDILQRDLSKAEMEELVRKIVEYRTERLNIVDFYDYLLQKARCVGMDMSQFSNIQRYKDYLVAYMAIDKMKLFDEIERAEDDLRKTLAGKTDAGRITELSKIVEMMDNMLSIRFTTRDYEFYLNHKKDFRIDTFMPYVLDRLKVYNIEVCVDADIKKLDGFLEKMEKFYEYSFKRDGAFISNMKYGDVLDAANSKRRVAVLITGGFHTDNLIRLFREKKMPYISIIPKFTNCPDYKCPYMRILGGGLSEEWKNVREKLGMSTMAIASLNTGLGREVRSGALDVFHVLESMRVAVASGKKGVHRNGTFCDYDWNVLPPEQDVNEFIQVEDTAVDSNAGLKAKEQDKVVDVGNENPNGPSPGSILGTGFKALLLAPFWEEPLFRGFTYAVLSQGDFISAAIINVIFVALHVFNLAKHPGKSWKEKIIGVFAAPVGISIVNTFLLIPFLSVHNGLYYGVGVSIGL